jgi:hypothetical protein
MTSKEKTCARCGQTFTGRRRSRFCSHYCYRRVWAALHWEREKDYKCRWDQRNAEQHIATTLAWRSKNHARHRATENARRHNNLDEYRARDRARYLKAVGRPLQPGMGRPRLPTIQGKQ